MKSTSSLLRKKSSSLLLRRGLWTLSALLIFAGIAVRQKAERFAGPLENPLEGDTEEAAAGVAEILERLPADQHLPRLKAFLQSSNPGLRSAAVDALGETGKPEVAPEIETAFLDSASIVRQRAMEALPKVDREKGLRLLLIGLQDEDTWIQEAAIAQISSAVSAHAAWGDRRVISFLMKALEGSNPVVAALAQRPLRKLTGQPWKTERGMTEAQRTAVYQKWKRWWALNRPPNQVPTEFSALSALRPMRTDPSPDFRLTDLTGKEVSLQGQKGRVTLLNFWGSWCPPCQGEVPDLVRLEAQFGARGLDVIGVALNEESETALQTWCRTHGVNYRQALSTEAIQKSFGDIHEVPVSVLLDGKGRIRYRWEGERNYSTFRAAVERLLKEQTLSAP